MKKMKTHIMKTFMALNKTRPIDKISVNEVVKNAHINRSTFYYYFENIDALIQELENQLLENFNHIQKVFYDTLISGIDEKKVAAIETFVDENEILMKMFLLKKQSFHFIDKLTKQALRNDATLMNLEELNLTKKQEYTLKYILNAQLWLFAYWLENEKEIPVEELIRMGRDFLTRGPIGEILDLEKEVLSCR